MKKEIFNHKIDALVVFGESNRRYYSGITTSAGCVIITAKKNYYLTDFRYKTYAENELDSSFELVLIKKYDGLYQQIKELLKRDSLKFVGFEDSQISFDAHKSLKSALDGFTLKPAGAFIESDRAIKTEDEIQKIKRAQEIAEQAFEETLDAVKLGMTERDVLAELNYQLIKKGSGKLPFEPIIASGANSACPHHHAGNKTIEKGETVLFDFGATFNGYASDISRTLVWGGCPKEIETIYDYVLEAQTYALKNIKAGITCFEADSFAREFIKANGYGDNFGHALGHGVGLDVHEFPRVGFGVDTVLEPNMVITVEPGIYVEGLGGVRIEDIVVVKENGIENLTTFHKDIHH